MTAAPAAARLPVLLVGAGAIGSMHARRAVLHADVDLCAIVDPTEAGRRLAESLDRPWFAELEPALDAAAGRDARAAIVATPNRTHVDIASRLVERGLPVLVEKPIADRVEDAQRLVDLAAARGVPLLVGHHRRHNPIVRQARRWIDEGLLGRLVSACVMATWLKPDSYFEPDWRRAPGAGPVLVNLIHDIDVLRHLLGEIAQVQAMASNERRGFANEDTAAITLRFANGALGSLIVSDCAVSPWNWDLGAGEAAHYPQQAADSSFISGTDGAFTLPGLQRWRYAGRAGWHEPLTSERTALHAVDTYSEQLRHLRAVAEGREAPRCSGLDGLRTLQATRAVLDSAASGQLIDLTPLHTGGIA